MSDWAGVLEVWTWTYYSAEANTQMGRRMHQNGFSGPEIKKKHILGRGTARPIPTGDGHTLPYSTPISAPYCTSILALSAFILAP